MCGQFLNNNNCHSVSSTMLHDLYTGQRQNCFSKLWHFWEWKLIIMLRHWAQTGTALSKGGHMSTLFIIFTLSNNRVSLSSMHIFDEKKKTKINPKKETNRTWDRDLLKARMVVSSINPSPSPADNCIVCFNHSKDQRIKNTVRNLVLYRYFHFYFCWLMSLPGLSLLHPLSFPPCSLSLCFSLCVLHTHTHTHVLESTIPSHRPVWKTLSVHKSFPSLLKEYIDSSVPCDHLIKCIQTFTK